MENIEKIEKLVEKMVDVHEKYLFEPLDDELVQKVKYELDAIFVEYELPVKFSMFIDGDQLRIQPLDLISQLIFQALNG